MFLAYEMINLGLGLRMGLLLLLLVQSRMLNVLVLWLTVRSAIHAGEVGLVAC